MAKLQVKANELRDVKVRLVSLVKRGANRLPIRVMKGDTAVLDLYTHFVRKDDMSDEDMMKREKQKKADIQAAMGLLQNAGYGIFKLDAIKSEPADDGEGKDEGKNPADGSDAGGPRDDGTSGTPDSGKLMDGADADAGGPRDNGTDGAAVALTNDYVPINKAEKAAVKAALAAVRKSAADPDNDGDNDADPAGDTDGDATTVDPAKPAPMPAMKTGKTTKADPKMSKKPVACADESDMPNPNEMAGGVFHWMVDGLKPAKPELVLDPNADYL
jgi:hypothetical protein